MNPSNAALRVIATVTGTAIGARLRVLPAQPHGLRVTLTWPAQPMPPTSRDTP